MLFIGFHHATIDAKNRIKFPARHCVQIKELCAGKLILTIHPDDPCLLLYPLLEWKKIEEKISALPSLNAHVKRLKRKLIGYAVECELDSSQRILVPSALREIIPMDKKLYISGQGKNFELWSEKAWHQNLAQLDKLSSKEDIPEELLQLSI